MIFVTVGTHEQQFDRLIKHIDELKMTGKISEDVVMQTGYCVYEPVACKWNRILPFDEMKENVSKARIIITHGGPSSFIMALQDGKIPIVVPRQKRYGEHVNDHQVEFVAQVATRMKNIIALKEVDNMLETIRGYDEIVENMTRNNCSNNEHINYELSKIVCELMESTR